MGSLGTFGHYRIPSPYELEFEVEYEPPIEQLKDEMQRETRTFKRDNTFVAKPIFKNFH